MADELTLYRLDAKHQLERLKETTRSLKRGRGAELGTLIAHILSRFEETMTACDVEFEETLDNGYSED
ncbi:hypothetical protein ABTF01_19875, partial [Acinetobacter baumannii]